MSQDAYISVRIPDAGSEDQASVWGRKGIEEGAEGAQEEGNEVQLFFPENAPEALERFQELLREEGLEYRTERIPDQDWNKRWEEGFHPVWIGNDLVIRAPFHPAFESTPYRILVRPERAFGTGHHPTTRLMLEKILKLPLQRREVLDMGCGTGILAILCEMRGAERILAIDNDPWAVSNAQRTVKENGCKRIQVEEGSELPWKGTGFDVILGNIQRDPLLSMIPDAAQTLNFEGALVLSGLRSEDLTRIRGKCEEEGLALDELKEAEGWVMLTYQKRSE